MKRELAHDENRAALGFDPSHVLTGEAKTSFWLRPPLILIHRELCHVEIKSLAVQSRNAVIEIPTTAPQQK